MPDSTKVIGSDAKPIVDYDHSFGDQEDLAWLDKELVVNPKLDPRDEIRHQLGELLVYKVRSQ